MVADICLDFTEGINMHVPLNVADSDTIGSIKHMIRAKIGIPTSQLTLINVGFKVTAGLNRPEAYVPYAVDNGAGSSAIAPGRARSRSPKMRATGQDRSIPFTPPGDALQQPPTPFTPRGDSPTREQSPTLSQSATE